MSRSKSAGEKHVINDELRSICKRIAPYIVHQWRDVCEDLGVSCAVLDTIEADHADTRLSEIAFRGLCKWQDMVGRAANKEKINRAIQKLGLKRAEDEMRCILSQKRAVPYMGSPATAAVTHETSAANKHSRQKAVADRLSRPKSTSSTNKKPTKQKKILRQSASTNPIGVHVTSSKPTDICEVKIKITVNGIQRLDKDKIEQTHDDFKSTKNDYKGTCFTFVKLVLANRRAHIRELKELLGVSGVSVQRLSQIGFNINVYLLCSSLGVFEILRQNHITGRLKKIMHSALVTRDHLTRLKAQQLELCVEMEEGLINKYRDILLMRKPAGEVVLHPVDVMDDYFECDDDEECSINNDINADEIRNFNLKSWHQELHSNVLQIDERYQKFEEESLKDLLIILRIVRRSTEELTCLQDIINSYRYLKYSKTVAAQGTRSDIVYKYLAIVNIIRLAVQEVSDKLLIISFEETLHPDSCEALYRLLAQIEDMLHPGYTFEAGDITTRYVATGLERELFGAFICYLPKLMQKMCCICDTLTATIDICGDADNTVGDDDTKPTSDNCADDPTEMNNNTLKSEFKMGSKQPNNASPEQPYTVPLELSNVTPPELSGTVPSEQPNTVPLKLSSITPPELPRTVPPKHPNITPPELPQTVQPEPSNTVSPELHNIVSPLEQSNTTPLELPRTGRENV